METITAPETDRYGLPKYADQRMTKADFLNWEPDDTHVYEYNDGLLEPTISMRQDENYLLTNLENVFFATEAFRQGTRLRAKMDIWVSETQMRRPDVSFYTADQIRQLATGLAIMPIFVVEFGSRTDSEVKSIRKRHQYFATGVQVLWWVFPEYQEVYVYTSPKAITICTGTNVLSAAPALPDLRLTVAELFRV